MMVLKGQSNLRASTMNQSLGFCSILLPIHSPVSHFQMENRDSEGAQ